MAFLTDIAEFTVRLSPLLDCITGSVGITAVAVEVVVVVLGLLQLVVPLAAVVGAEVVVAVADGLDSLIRNAPGSVATILVGTWPVVVSVIRVAVP